MESGQILRLYSKSKVVISAVKDALISSGGETNASGQLLFPLHARGISKEEDKSFLPVEDSLIEPAVISGDAAGLEANSPKTATADNLCFDASIYFRSLQTNQLGQNVLFAQKIPSTVHIVDRLAAILPDNVGLIVTAAQQTSGKGRSGNVWDSPLGCAMFSFPLTIPLSSTLGQGLTFIQHLVATACVLAVRNTSGYEDVDLRIKWPNDIVTSEKVKVGGVLVTSSILRDKAHCNIGIGVNVTNSAPTTCLNDLIRRLSTATAPQPFTVERFIARTLTELERLLNAFASQGAESFLPVYLKHWLHMNQTVKVQVTDPEASSDIVQHTSGHIIGLDDHGFLQVKISGGEVWSVQSDGNRFDMMANLLLLRKIT